MKDLSDLSRYELEELCGEYQGFVYAFRNSFMLDEIIYDKVANLDDPEVMEDYEILVECFNSVSTTEDKFLRTEWLMREIIDEF